MFYFTISKSMKNSHTSRYCLFIYLCLCTSLKLSAQTTLTWYGQTFRIDTLYPATGSTGMSSPWEVLYGPDDSLWVTESHGYKIYKIHPGDKGSRVVLDMNGLKDFTAATANPWPQGGLMGLALHPDFYSGKPWVYIAYVYHLIGCSDDGAGTHCSYNTKIVRYRYSFSNGTLTYMDDILSGLHGSNDHNSGRIRISPLPEGDGRYHLYYTIGDQGAGNLTNKYRTNYAQDTMVVEGKVLRLNVEPDLSQPPASQWIPTDNPWPNSPIYTFGHRNPQGLDFGSVDGGASYILYSSEHGDQSDDEVNIIVPHTNYGWPKIAGLCDDNYTSKAGDSMYLANKAVISEHGFCDTTQTTLAEPIFSFYNWGRSANKTSGAKGNMYWPTIAPSAIRFYGQGAIPGWNYSLLVPSLKNGLFRLKLTADGLNIDSTGGPSDTLHYLAGYRLRNITIAPTGDTLFLAVDNSCCTLGSSGTIGNSVGSPNLGFILRMVYLTTLPLHDTALKTPPRTAWSARVYPNPAHDLLYIDAPAGEQKPWIAQLYSAAGQPLRTRTATTDQFTLDLHGLPPGVYILRLTNATGVTSLINKVLID